MKRHLWLFHTLDNKAVVKFQIEKMDSLACRNVQLPALSQSLQFKCDTAVFGSTSKCHSLAD